MSAELSPRLVIGRRGFIPWVCTNNPFYVLSAGLFFIGLRLSFDMTGDVQAWAMISGLTGYTLLLTVTGIVLVRLVQVWDDARTILLLIVLMLLAASVTLDELLVVNPLGGSLCYLGGLLFAVAISEATLRGIHLRLPAGYRIPYHLMLALFFLYPPALAPWLDQPHGEPLMWGLFGFSLAAGLVFLTLLPAVRRGPAYLLDNGSPWPWPLYPWSLFGLLALAVIGRSILLCWSFHLLEIEAGDSLIFGPYFLVPFGFALAILLLEMGLAWRNPSLQTAAMLSPAVLLVLASAPPGANPIYQEFLAIWVSRLGGNPLWVTLVVVLSFYGYAMLRGVPLASAGLTAMLLGLSFIGPQALLAEPMTSPLLLAALLQLVLALHRRSSLHALTGLGLLTVLATLLADPAYRLPLSFHLTVLTLLAVGIGRADCRLAGLVLVGLAGTLSLPGLGDTTAPGMSEWYSLLLASAILGYGWLLHDRQPIYLAAALTTAWLLVLGWRVYQLALAWMAGLNLLLISLSLFALAVLVSLLKTGRLSRWIVMEDRQTS